MAEVAEVAEGEDAGRLPVYLTTFVGRRAELRELPGVLAGHRLLTISGAGGCGKTRLASRLLGLEAERWPDGVRWADLGAVSDPSRVPDLMAAAAGVLVDPARGPLAGLRRELADRHLCLCLDNCEHLLDVCAEVVEDLLSACPGLTVLVTSREPLGVAGETVWRVPSMHEAEAVELFADRARNARPDYAAPPGGPTSDPGAAGDGRGRDGGDPAGTLCRRLDGIPLAIELAAAWIRVLTPTQIADALDDRFDLLVGAGRNLLPRQQTLAASVGWSHDLLGEDARVLLRRLGVFAGGCTLDAARAVCAGDPLAPGDVLGALRRLVDASMCNVEHRAGATRYRLLETIREYALARLDEAGETATWRGRHLDHFLAVAEAGAAAIDVGDHDVELAALQAEHDNLRAALDWGLTRPDPDRGRRLAAALTPFWFLRGHAHQGLRLLQRALHTPAGWAGSPGLADPAHLRQQAELLCRIGLLAVPAGRFDLIEDAARRAVELGTTLGDDDVLAQAHTVAAYIPFYVDLARSQELAQLARRHHDAASDAASGTGGGPRAGTRFAADFATLLEAYTLINRDRFDEAMALAMPLYERSWARHDRFIGGFAWAVRQWDALYRGDVRAGLAAGQRAAEMARPLNDWFVVGTSMVNLSWAYGLAGDLVEGRRVIDGVVRSLETQAQAGSDADAIGVSWAAGDLSLWDGDLEAAVRWFGVTIGRRGPLADNWMTARCLPGMAEALRHLGRHDEAAGHAARGVELAERMDVVHVLTESREELGHLAAAGGDPGRAEDLHHEVLRLRVERLPTFVPDSLDALAGLAAAGERWAAAARLLAASDAGRGRVGYPRRKLDRPGHEAVVAAVRSALGDDELDAAWTEGTSLALDEAAAYAARSRGPRQRPARGWGSLTPTEQQVVDLVAEGLTNPQIAERLFVSRATVKTHLSHVYTKLDISTRAQLAALATRHRAGDDPG